MQSTHNGGVHPLEKGFGAITGGNGRLEDAVHVDLVVVDHGSGVLRREPPDKYTFVQLPLHHAPLRRRHCLVVKEEEEIKKISKRLK